MCNTEDEIEMADIFYERAIDHGIDKMYNIEFIHQIIRVHLKHYYMKSIGRKTKNTDSDLVYLVGMSGENFDDYINVMSSRYKTSNKDYIPPLKVLYNEVI